MRINHNVTAQLANINMKKTNKRLTSSLESLSSGYKINSAADDSAGLAISNKMRTQIRALDQASRNADDGTSIIQIAEGGLSEITSILQRVRELSVQAANDTNTVDDREAMQLEIDKLLDEVDRIGSETEYNGNGLLDGSFTRVVTYNQNGLDTLYISAGVKAGEYELTVSQTAQPATIDITIPGPGETIIINGTPIKVGEDEDPQVKITDVCDKMGIDVDGTTLTTRASGASQRITVKYADEDEPEVAEGVDAEISLSGDNIVGELVYLSDGKNVTVRGNDGFEMKIAVEDGASDATMIVYDTGSMILQIGANEHQNVAVDFPEISCKSLSLREEGGTSIVNVCSQYGAENAITQVENAIRHVTEVRTQLGAYQNRLDATVSSLDVTSENLTGAMSRIIDTDMATAMTNYTQESVLIQAATSILAQANNRPQQVLSLLQS